MTTRVYVESFEMEEGSIKKEKKKKENKVIEASEKIRNVPKRLWDVGREDPRRAIHALKVGVSLTLVSLLYLIEPWYKGIGNNAIWAVVTVAVVLQFSVGATLCKGLNRGLGTLMASFLALLIILVSQNSGKIFGPICIGASILLIGATSTYLRFFPYIKKNHDYGMVIFLVTFDMIILPGYRANSVIKIIQDRFLSVVMGCGVCLLMSLFVFPIWSGEDLHKSTISKLQGLSQSVEACVHEYFDEIMDQDDKAKESWEERYYEGYKTVLDSKISDEQLALYARMEPRHLRHCHRTQWNQYLKVGAVLRRFGYTVVALHGCLQTEIQTPKSVRAIFKDPCIRLTGEVCKVLSELADGVRNRRHCSPEILSDNLHEALHDLNSTFKSQPKLFLGSNQNDAVSLHNSTAERQNDIVSANIRIQRDKNNDVSNDNSTTHQNDVVSNLNSKEHLNDVVSRVKEDTSAPVDNRTPVYKRGKNVNSEISSAMSPASLEFSEALSLAAFASMLVEMTVRLDNVIAEVEELGRIACFKDYDPTAVVVRCEEPPSNRAVHVARISTV